MGAVSTVLTKTPFEARILAQIAAAVEDLGFAIVRVRVLGGRKSHKLQIMAERAADGAMGVDDCAVLSRAISALLDVADPFSGAWELEVSSPGVDRPLTQLDHFARWAGFDVKIELDRLVEGRKRFSGLIAGVDGEAEAVLLNPPEDEDTLAIPFAWISEARLALTDALIAESLRRGTTQSVDALGSDVELDAGDDGPTEDDEGASVARNEEV